MSARRSRSSWTSPRAWALGALVASATAAAGACGGDLGVAPPIGFEATGGGAASSSVGLLEQSASTGAPPVDSGSYCGNEFHQIVADAPNIVFVFDASGSMATLSGTATRYERVRQAAISLVEQLGPLINVGVARFPVFATQEDSCRTGQLVMPVASGDAEPGGATTTRFIQASAAEPSGGTPLAATLRAIADPLSFVPGRTILVLATDGAPNCNATLVCTAAACSTNIEGACPVAPDNCCVVDGYAGPTACVDATDAIDAVHAFADDGVPVYVVGIPGSEQYGYVLDQLALAGGTPAAASPYYLKVEDLGTLTTVFGSIASLAISCDFDLADPPDAEGDTNVYLDGVVLPQNPVNGWAWSTPSRVELRGAACADLKAGKVKSVQIVSGCPTVIH